MFQEHILAQIWAQTLLKIEKESSKAVKDGDKEKYAESIEEIFSQGAEQIYLDFCKVNLLQDFEHKHDHSHHNLDLCHIERYSVLIKPFEMR